MFFAKNIALFCFSFFSRQILLWYNKKILCILGQQPSKVFRSPAAAKQALEIEKRIKNNEATNDDLFEHVQLCYLSNNPENGLEWAVKILKGR